MDEIKNVYLVFKKSNHLLGLILFVFIFGSCKSPKSGKIFDGVIDIVTLRGPSAISMIEMIDDPPVIFDSVKTHFVIKNEPSQVQAMLLNNEVDFAIVPTTLASILYNKGAKYKIAGIPVWGTLYLFGSDSILQSWEDLKGHRIYVMERGLTPDAMFRFLLSSHGLNPDKDVILDYSYPGHDELARAVAANKAPLAVISEPLVSMVMNVNKKVRPIFDLNKEWFETTKGHIPCAQTALVVHSSFAENYPGLVESFMKEYDKNIHWINRNLYEAASLVIEYKILSDTSVAVSSIPRCNIMFTPAREIENGILKYLTIFYNFDPRIIGGTIPNEEIFYR